MTTTHTTTRVNGHRLKYHAGRSILAAHWECTRCKRTGQAPQHFRDAACKGDGR